MDANFTYRFYLFILFSPEFGNPGQQLFFYLYIQRIAWDNLQNKEPIDNGTCE
jgi:hypothetical protein